MSDEENQTEATEEEETESFFACDIVALRNGFLFSINGQSFCIEHEGNSSKGFRRVLRHLKYAHNVYQAAKADKGKPQ